MTDKNKKTVEIGSKISIDSEKQPIFEVIGFRGTNLLLKCVDDKGEKEMFANNKLLLLPERTLSSSYSVVD